MGSTLSPPGPNAVHLCVDVQNLFAPGGPWATPWMEKALPSMCDLRRTLPSGPSSRVLFRPRRRPFDEGMWREYYRKWQNVTRDRLDPEVLDLVPDLRKFAPPASVIDRMVYSAFAGGRLVEFLSEHHVDTLIVSGGETDVCVLSTVLAAIDLGYRIILVEGALCSSSDESHDAILNLYRRRFDIHVEVANVEQILGLWVPAYD